MVTKIPRPGSKAEETLALHLRAHNVRHYLREHRFAPPRRWRFDFAWPELMLAVEVEGLTGGAGGRHQRIAGMEGDLEKYEAAQLQGWTIYRCSQSMVSSGRAVETIQKLIAMKEVTLCNKA